MASDSKGYRLNLKTGEVNYITSEGIFNLSPDGLKELKPGQYLKLEDGKYLEYTGNGIFEKKIRYPKYKIIDSNSLLLKKVHIPLTTATLINNKQSQS